MARRGSGIGQLAFSPGVPPLAPFLRRRRALDADAYRHLHTVGTWNLLEHQLAGEVSNRPLAALPPMAPDSPGILRLLVERWASLAEGDTGNLPLPEAARTLDLTANQRRALSQAGVKDLRGLARLLRSEPEAKKRREELHRLAESLPTAEAERILDPPEPSLAPEILKRIETRIAGALRRPAP